MKASERRDENYLSRHFNGVLPLSLSFWINLILVNVVMSFVQVGVASAYGPWSTEGIGALFIAFTIWLWGAVGVWRSADAYTKAHRGRPWGYIASGVVVVQGLVWVAHSIPQN